MSESNLWARTRARIGPFGRLARVENSCDLGTPDVAYCLGTPRTRPASGWLELKHVPYWPARENTPLVIKKLTVHQVTWQEEWAKAGGRVFTLIQVEHDILLASVPTLRRIFERGLSKADLVGESLLFSRGGYPTGEVLKWLIKT